MENRKSFWISLCLVNLSIVAILGLILRSKILFPIPAIDYRNVLSAHSHFAFGGWVGLCLFTLLVYELLPPEVAAKKKYQWILAGIEISSLGMAFTFPFVGYNPISITFSSLYILVSFVFAFVFMKDLLRNATEGIIRILGPSAIASLVISSIGPLGLAYILISKSGNSLLYRDSIYTFLHFQYNGFFTLSVIALFLNRLVKKGLELNREVKMFALFLCLSIIPCLFLSLLWHNKPVYYWFAGVGCLLILICLYYFFVFLTRLDKKQLFTNRLVRSLWMFSFLSFSLKMILNAGTIIPSLSNAVYGDRPVIIGFLHLVFLGFVTFYILSALVEDGYFSRQDGRPVAAPFILFSTGIIINELILMLQGLGILFKTNSYLFNWLLWITAIILFMGALLITITKHGVQLIKKP
ncbi:MAG: hypothetical protein ACJ749_03430 [Flavisolibacter sp.]